MISIKKAGIDDIEIIRALAQQTWPEAYGNILGKQQLDYMLELFYHAVALQKQMEEMNHQFIIIYASGIPAGFASYSPKSANTDVFRLHKLYVLPGMQAKGLGKSMLDHIINDISHQQAKWLELNVNRENKAILFYTKNGFTVTREEDIDIGEGFFMNDYVMTKAL